MAPLGAVPRACLAVARAYGAEARELEHTVRAGKAVLVTVGPRIRGVLRARGDGNIVSFLRGTIVYCGVCTVSWLTVRVRPRDGLRAQGLHRFLAAARWQHRDEGVRTPDMGLIRDFVLIGSASFGSCRPPPDRSLLRCGGTRTNRQRGSVKATKRGSEELFALAATSARPVRRIRMRWA